MSDWQEVSDPAGKKYYWNRKTNATSWTVPDGFRGAAPAAAPAPAPARPPQQQQPPQQQRYAPPAGASGAPQSDWRETKDPSGKTYYWNKATKETSWTRPAAMGPPGGAGGGGGVGGGGPSVGQKRGRSPGPADPAKRHAGQGGAADAQLEALINRVREMTRMMPQLFVDGPIPPLTEFLHELSIRKADLGEGRMTPENVAIRLGELSRRMDMVQQQHSGGAGGGRGPPPPAQGPPKAAPGIHPSRMGLVTGPTANGPPPLEAPQASGRRNFGNRRR